MSLHLHVGNVTPTCTKNVQGLSTLPHDSRINLNHKHLHIYFYPKHWKDYNFISGAVKEFL